MDNRRLDVVMAQRPLHGPDALGGYRAKAWLRIGEGMTACSLDRPGLVHVFLEHLMQVPLNHQRFIVSDYSYVSDPVNVELHQKDRSGSDHAVRGPRRSGSDHAKAGPPKERVVLIGYLRTLECVFRPRNGNFNADSARFKGMRNRSKKIVYEVSGN